MLPVAYLPLSLALGHSSLTIVYVAEVISGLLIVAAFCAGYLACRAYTGSKWAGLLGGLIIGWFPVLQMEVGWGGQAQLVAYVLGLLALWVIIDKVLLSLSLQPALFAGLLLLVAAGSELYATATLVLAVALYLLFTLGRRLFTRGGILTLVAVLGPPLAGAALLIRTNPAATSPTGEATLSAYWTNGSLYHELWLALTFDNSIIGAAYIGVAALYVVYRVILTPRTRAQVWLVPATGIAAVAVGAFVTPIVNADRAVYPLVFPIAFAVAEMATLWPRSAVAAVRKPRWRLRREEVSWAFPIFAVAMLTVTGVQIGSDIQTYQNSLAYYSFDQGYLSELFWLTNEPGAILYDSSPIDHTFAALWATNRPIYPGPAFQPYTVTSRAKQATVLLATSLSFGEDWIDDGQYIVIDAENAWGQPDPGVLVAKNARLVLSIESDDFLNTVTYSPGSDPNVTDSAELFSASSVSTIAGKSGLNTSYVLSGFSVNRTLAVSTQGTIYWNYSFAFSSAIPRGVSLFVTDSTKTPTTGRVENSSLCCSNASLAQVFPTSELPPEVQSYAVSGQATGATLTSQYVASDQVPESSNWTITRLRQTRQRARSPSAWPSTRRGPPRLLPPPTRRTRCLPRQGSGGSYSATALTR